MQIIEFDSFETAFPVQPGEEGDAKRRFMTLFARGGDQAQVGGTSYVCKASSFTGEEFAVKRLLPNAGIPKDANLTPEDTARITQGHAAAFYEEYKNQLLVSRMRGFPKVYGYGTIGDDPAIVMEWVEGISVRDFSRQRAEVGEALSAQAIAALGASVLEVLDTAGRLDSTLVHRDISPANIMIRTGGAAVEEQVERGIFDICLIDFGSASADAPQDASFTMVSQVWRNGTPEYAPPEMLTQDIPHIDRLRKSQAIDVFALCSVLYELYAGHTPWRVGDHPELSPFRLKTERDPEPVASRQPEDEFLVNVLFAGLAVDQAERPSVRRLLAQLREIAPLGEGEGSGAGEGSFAARMNEPIGRDWMPAGLYTPDSTRLKVAGADEGGRRAGEDIAPYERPATLLTRRNLIIGGLVLAAAAASGALAARSCQGEASYDFSSYPTADSVYAGDSFYPVMRMDDSAWVLRDVRTGAEISIGSGNREPGRIIAGLMRAYDPASGNYGFMTAVEAGSASSPSSSASGFSCAWRILPTYADAGDFSSPEGDAGADAGGRLAAVQDAASGLWGYIDSAGSMAIPPVYAEAGRFSHGYAPVRLVGETLWGVIDALGNQVVAPRFRGLGMCSEEGFMAAAEQSGDRWGFIDVQGAWAIPDDFAQVRRFSGGVAACRRSGDGLWEYVDASGATVIEARFADAFPFADGLAPAQDAESQLWGLIDPEGAWRAEPRFLSLGEKAGALFPAHGSPAGVYDIEGADRAAWRAFTAAHTDWSFGYGFVDGTGAWAVNPIYGDALIRTPEQ